MYRKIYKNVTIKSLDNNPNNRSYELDYISSINISENISNSNITATITIPAPKMNFSVTNQKGKKTFLKRSNTHHRFYFTNESFVYEGKIRIKKPDLEIHSRNTDYLKRTYNGSIFGFKTEDVKLEFNAYRTLISIYTGYKKPMVKTLKTDRPNIIIGNTEIENVNKNTLEVIDTEQIPYNFIGVATRFEFDIKNNCYIIHCQDLSSLLTKKKFTLSYSGGQLSNFISNVFFKAGYPFDASKLTSTSLSTANTQNSTDYFLDEINSNPHSKYFRGVVNIEDINTLIQIDEITLPPITIKKPSTALEIFKLLEESYGIYSYFGLTAYNNSSLLYFHSGYKYIRFNRFKNAQLFSYPLSNIRYEEAPVIDINLDLQTYKPKSENLVVIYTTAFNGNSYTLYTIDGVHCYTDKELTFNESNPEELRISQLINFRSKQEIENDLSTREDRREMKMIGIPIVDLYNMTVNVWKSVPDNGFSGSITTFGDYNIHKSDRIGIKVDNLSKSGDSIGFYFVDSYELNMNNSVGIQQNYTFKTKLS